MDAFALRLAADQQRLDALAAASGGRVMVLAAPAAHSPRLEVLLRYPTAAGPDYPVRRSEESRLAVSLGARYPFQPPVATFLTPVFHPNVFPSGVVCLGARWLPSEGMDLFLQRVIRLMTFDPLLVNIHSAAHPRALHWYLQARAAHPGAFPGERVDFGAGGVSPHATLPPEGAPPGLGRPGAGGVSPHAALPPEGHKR
ncbi:MAG: hypothetical protein HY778_05475 [Betaproteobacteria bacterium]|nr:hypothetical protein [Betaproteobacteria bacterium]